MRGNPLGRMDALELRLDVQEQATGQLLDRSIKIKQDLLENMNFTQESWQEEKDARETLQTHVKTITNVVKQLSKDVQVRCSTCVRRVKLLIGTISRRLV